MFCLGGSPPRTQKEFRKLLVFTQRQCRVFGLLVEAAGLDIVWRAWRVCTMANASGGNCGSVIVV
eukprot:4190171-Amphidinium_carterae.1